MSLLSKHIGEFKSEEFVLGMSGGFKGEAGTNFAGIESTKIVIVSTPASKNWHGFTAIEQKIADAEVGKSMEGRGFPARCMITYKRVSGTEKKQTDRGLIEADVEKLVVVAIEYLCQVDLVDIKIQQKHVA